MTGLISRSSDDEYVEGAIPVEVTLVVTLHSTREKWKDMKWDNAFLALARLMYIAGECPSLKSRQVDWWQLTYRMVGINSEPKSKKANIHQIQI